MKSPEAAMAASAVVGTVAMVQLLTDWDPLGRCFTFVKQLRGHVRVLGSFVCSFVVCVFPGSSAVMTCWNGRNQMDRWSGVDLVDSTVKEGFPFSHVFFSCCEFSPRAQEKRLSCAGSVKEGANGYLGLHGEEDVQVRNAQYKKLVNAYYDLATVFYEWGWGPSFHFHSRFPFESFWEGTRRHEYQLAAHLNVTHKGHVLDVGCGIGGPMRNIARFLNCQVTGLTLNPYQVERGNEIAARDPTVATKTRSVQGDFMELPFAPNTFQAAYAIEGCATAGVSVWS